MTLIEDFEAALKEDEYLDPNSVQDLVKNVKLVSDEFQESGRWTEHWVAVFNRLDEYVAVSYEIAATEMQEGSESESEVYEVEPVKVTTIRYDKKVDY